MQMPRQVEVSILGDDCYIFCVRSSYGTSGTRTLESGTFAHRGRNAVFGDWVVICDATHVQVTVLVQMGLDLCKYSVLFLQMMI
jgi:hypothetical protein